MNKETIKYFLIQTDNIDLVLSKLLNCGYDHSDAVAMIREYILTRGTLNA